MKAFCLLLVAFCVSLVVSEFTMSSIVGYPPQLSGERVFKLDNHPKYYEILHWKPPHYRYWNTEDGVNSVKLNNIGLTGNDVHLSQEAYNIYLLGDSFMEARQYKGREIAAGIIQDKLQVYHPRWQVINVAYSGHDPYAQWYRTMFFSRHYNPSKVVIVYESFDRLSTYFSRWENPISHELRDSIQYTELRTGHIEELQARIRSISAYASLILNKPFRLPNIIQRVRARKRRIPHNHIDDKLSPYETYLSVINGINAFYSRYEDNFFFVSIMRDNPFEKDIEKYCSSNNVKYFHNDDIMLPNNLIRNSGHLNREGNLMLGNYVSSILQGYLSD